MLLSAHENNFVPGVPFRSKWYMSSYIRTCSIFSDAIEQLIASGCLTQSCLTRNFHVGSDPSHVVSPHRHRGSPRDAECDQFHHHHHRTVSPIHHRPALPPDSTVDGHRETSPCQHRNVSQLIGTVLRNGGALTGEQQTMLRHLCDRCAQTLAFAVCGQLQDLSKQLQVLQQVKTPVKTDRCDGPLQDLLTRLQLDYEDEHQKVCSLRQDLMQLEQTKVGMPELWSRACYKTILCTCISEVWNLL